MAECLIDGQFLSRKNWRFKMIRLIKLGGVLPRFENKKGGRHWVKPISETHFEGRGSEA